MSEKEINPVVSEDSYEADIPDKGTTAWLVVVGAFCANVTTNGFMNTTGTIQEYIGSHQLSNYNESTLGWVFSLFMFFMYFGSIQAGPLVDAYGLKPVLYPGCILWCASLFILGSCKEFYQFIIGFSVLGGLSSSLIMNPSFTVINHWFSSKKNIALGIVATGASVCGCFLPIVLSVLFDKIGYGWTIRVLAFCITALCGVACLTMKSRTPKRKIEWKDIIIDVKCLKDWNYALCCFGLFLVEWAYCMPSLFLVTYAKTAGFSSQSSNLLLVYQNIGSTFGRLGAGYAARYAGTYNCMSVFTALAGLCSLCIWLPSGYHYGGLVGFSVVYGFFSGCCISVAPSTIASVSSVADYGKRYGTAYAIASIGVLISLPIGGLLTDKAYLGVKIATGLAYILSSFTYLLSRYLSVGWQKHF